MSISKGRSDEIAYPIRYPEREEQVTSLCWSCIAGAENHDRWEDVRAFCLYLRSRLGKKDIRNVKCRLRTRTPALIEGGNPQ